MTGAQNYSVDALGFHVEGTVQNVSARVAFDHGRILVTALQSPVKVTKGGEFLTQVNAGSTYYFEPDVAAGTRIGDPQSAPKNISGGLSNGAKWGIIAGAGGGGVAGVVAATRGGHSSSNNSVSR